MKNTEQVNQIKRKMFKVVNSAKTEAQKQTAYNYMVLALKHIFKTKVNYEKR